MALDTRTAQTTLENLLRDTILYGLGQRLPQVATVVALRAFTTQGSGTPMRDDDDLVYVSGTTSSYRWSQVSQAADDGVAVIKPNDAGLTGRWLRWTSPLRFSPVVGGDSTTLDLLTSGPLAEVLLLDKDMSEDQVNALLTGQVPAVMIDAAGDTPEDAEQMTGRQWLTDYEFTISVLAENLRDGREAAQGSNVPNDSAFGANTIDGFLKVLLCGTQLDAALANGGIRNVRVGHAHNWISDLGQRRVVRSRTYTIQVTEEFLNAPNEIGFAQEVDVQSVFTAADSAHDSFDPANYLASGIAVPVAAGLTQTLSSGSAVIAGSTVNYTGVTHTFAPYSDTYRDLLPNGTLTFVQVNEAGPVPAVTATALRIGFTKTFGSAVVSDTILAATQQNYENRFVFPL